MSLPHHRRSRSGSPKHVGRSRLSDSWKEAVMKCQPGGTGVPLPSSPIPHASAPVSSPIPAIFFLSTIWEPGTGHKARRLPNLECSLESAWDSRTLPRLPGGRGWRRRSSWLASLLPAGSLWLPLAPRPLVARPARMRWWGRSWTAWTCPPKPVGSPTHYFHRKRVRPEMVRVRNETST